MCLANDAIHGWLRAKCCVRLGFGCCWQVAGHELAAKGRREVGELDWYVYACLQEDV